MSHRTRMLVVIWAAVAGIALGQAVASAAEKPQKDGFRNLLDGGLAAWQDAAGKQPSPGWVVDEIRKRSGVLHPGCDLPAAGSEFAPRDPARPPLIIWNHRWEFDKQPEVFFAALDAVHARGREFEVALLGENFQFVPQEFLDPRLLPVSPCPLEPIADRADPAGQRGRQGLGFAGITCHRKCAWLASTIQILDNRILIWAINSIVV